MANICENTFYAISDDRNNLDIILDYFKDGEFEFDYDDRGDCIYVYFSSEWVFPESEMQELYEKIPNKSDIYMRCLSVEYETEYHALWKCKNKNGWTEV